MADSQGSLGSHTGYLRYMDELALFADDRETLRSWRTEIAHWLRENRVLTPNPKKGHIRSAKLPQIYLGHKISRAG